MHIGVDYYPEHWDEGRWETDATLMEQAGFNVVRLAEFAWAMLEPSEGVFDFAWLDRSLDTLGRHGISAILGTPTGAMPAWLKAKYPEVMATGKDGVQVEWGVRKNNCFSSGTFRLLSERVTRAMATHYQHNPNVIGWQTDNEFGGPFCYCPSCRAAFQDWLHRKYGTTDALNKAHGNHFWGQLVSAWREVPLPVNFAGHNPSLCLDFQRFFSSQNVSFQAAQLQILREVCPGHFVTHNFMGLFSELDYYDLAAGLDFVSWDNYPSGGRPGENNNAAAMAADLTRGLKRKNFWIMEQSAGPLGWGCYSRNVRPGELRKIAFQQVAHGADGMVWFRWRTCTAGREQYWHGLLGHDGKALRRYDEAAVTAKELHALAPLLEGTTVEAKVAFVYDYDSLWAAQIQPGHEGNDYKARAQRLHDALRRAGVDVDMVPPDAELSGYRAVFAPCLYVMPDALALRLDRYVQDGGVLFCDGRTGVKDATSLCHARTLPGLLSDALGIAIEEYEATKDFSYPISGSAALPGSHEAVKYADWVKPTSAEVLASYAAWPLEGFAAATRNRHGKGFGFYLGCEVKDDAFYDALVRLVLDAAQTAPHAPPPGVELSVRSGAGKRLLFAVNHTEEERTVKIPEGAECLLGGATLGRYGVGVFKLP